MTLRAATQGRRFLPAVVEQLALLRVRKSARHVGRAVEFVRFPDELAPSRQDRSGLDCVILSILAVDECGEVAVDVLQVKVQAIGTFAEPGVAIGAFVESGAVPREAEVPTFFVVVRAVKVGIGGWNDGRGLSCNKPQDARTHNHCD